MNLVSSKANKKNPPFDLNAIDPNGDTVRIPPYYFVFAGSTAPQGDDIGSTFLRNTGHSPDNTASSTARKDTKLERVLKPGATGRNDVMTAKPAFSTMCHDAHHSCCGAGINEIGKLGFSTLVLAGSAARTAAIERHRVSSTIMD